MRIYVDSDVLIWHLRGQKKAFNLLQRLSNNKDYDLWTGALQRAEVVFFMRTDEADATSLFLSRFQTAPVDADIVDMAGALYRQWHPSHGIDVNDAFLAATAMKTGGKIVTLNVKHFPMTDLVVEKAW
jgi:predicted nucleic acid-binding protein